MNRAALVDGMIGADRSDGGRSDRGRRHGSLAILTEMDPWSASTRYRALQHVPRLQRFFSDVRVSLPHDPVGRSPGAAGRAGHFATHAARYAQRALAVARAAREVDALFIQRGLYVIGPGAIVASLAGYDGAVVYDLDDAVFELKPSLVGRGPLTRWLYGPQQAQALLRRADAVVVSTSELADALPAGSPPPTVLPSVPDPARYRTVVHTDATPVIVGWAGTVGGLCYLDALRTVIARLGAERLALLEVVCSQPWDGPSQFRRWTPAAETAVFEDFSIGIMPLPDHPYTRAKAGFKLLQYMACGIPVIASPVGINRRLVEASGSGYLAGTPAEWEEAIRTLAADPELRARLGARGRAFVESYADLDAQARTIAGLLIPSLSQLDDAADVPAVNDLTLAR